MTRLPRGSARETRTVAIKRIIRSCLFLCFCGNSLGDGVFVVTSTCVGVALLNAAVYISFSACPTVSSLHYFSALCVTVCVSDSALRDVSRVIEPLLAVTVTRSNNPYAVDNFRRAGLDRSRNRGSIT